VQATWLVPWGIIGFALFILLLAALGLHAACRWIGGLLLCLVACSSTLLVVLLTSSTIDVDEILFLLPCIGIAVFGGWLALAERPRRPVNA
jgi:hypothetical protein